MPYRYMSSPFRKAVGCLPLSFSRHFVRRAILTFDPIFLRVSTAEEESTQAGQSFDVSRKASPFGRIFLLSRAKR